LYQDQFFDQGVHLRILILIIGWINSWSPMIHIASRLFYLKTVGQKPASKV